ncbi:MAG: toxin-antitoxin system YwqK family antitoxin [Planctomycetota bacterium]|jgi:hypothetical protein
MNLYSLRHAIYLAVVAAAGLVLPGCAPADKRPTDPAGWLALAPPPTGWSDARYRAHAKKFMKLSLPPNLRRHVHHLPAEWDPYGEVRSYRRLPSLPWSLYPDAMPAAMAELGTEGTHPGYNDFTQCGAGLSIQWYPDGRPMAVEYLERKEPPSGDQADVEHHFPRGKGTAFLMQAKYYGPKGKLLSQVVDGKGVAMSMLISPRGLVEVSRTCEFEGGLPHGRWIEWADYDRGIKKAEYIYRHGELQATVAETDETEPPQETSEWFRQDWPTRRLPDPFKRFRRGPDGPAPIEAAGITVMHQLGDDKFWGVRSADEAIVFSGDGGRNWRVLKAGFDFQPMQMIVTRRMEIFVWGWKQTKHPEKGIPSRVVFSRDNGRTWRTAIPPASYTVEMWVDDEGVIWIHGRLLPKDGLAAGKHWFFLHSWAFGTYEGRGWIRRYEGGFYDVEYLPSPAGNAFASLTTLTPYHAPAEYKVYLWTSLAEMPRYLHGAGFGRPVPSPRWTPDGKKLIVDGDEVLDVEE